MLRCTLDLASADGSVYVDAWDYTLTFPGQAAWWNSTVPQEARRSSVSFSVAPD